MDKLKTLIPSLKGNINYEQSAKEWTWLGVGGKPIFTFCPYDINDLETFCKNLPREIQFRTLGAGSNILVRDNGYNGIFIRLQRGFRNLEFKNNQIIADAGLPGSYIVDKALENEMGGISFISTIPGRLGGLVKMNAGAHTKEMKDIIQWVEIMDRCGTIFRLTNEECCFSYRSSCIQESWIVLRACIKTQMSKREVIKEEINKFKEYRKNTQPTTGKMAGSFFKNPKNTQLKAWELIKEANEIITNKSIANENVTPDEKVGLSPMHANFIMNKKNATAQEIENFALRLQCNIFLKHNIWLESEVERIGY